MDARDHEVGVCFGSSYGERLFGETSDKKPMRLVDTQTVGDGIAFLTYEFVRGS